MSGVKDFISKEEKHERRLAKVMNWEYVEEQKKGSCYDFIAPDGEKIEVKFDWDSIKTGNHYLEFAQTNDNKVTWVPSGFSLSSEEVDYWVVINEEFLRIFRVDQLKLFLFENRATLKVKETRSGINSNAFGQFSKAYLIPFSLLDNISMIKMSNPIERSL